MGGKEGERYPPERTRELPRRLVTITKPFLMGKYEVTQQQWLDVMGELPQEMQVDTLFNQRFIGAHKPVLRLSWDEAQSFIEKLNARSTSEVYRLPTEAEWEYAARANTATEYFFGDEPDRLGEYAWYSQNANKRTHDVGLKKPNPWGLYDIYGNAFEWVQDGYSYYGDSYQTGTHNELIGEEKSYLKVVRGGSWRRPAFQARSSNRQFDRKDFGNFCHGLRLVRVKEVPDDS